MSRVWQVFPISGPRQGALRLCPSQLAALGLRNMRDGFHPGVQPEETPGAVHGQVQPGQEVSAAGDQKDSGQILRGLRRGLVRLQHMRSKVGQPRRVDESQVQHCSLYHMRQGYML